MRDPHNLLSTLIIMAVALSSCAQPDKADGGRTIFVDVTTRGIPGDGRSARTALPTIQQACDTAEPGDTILVAPGVYFEHVQLRRAGTRDRPIVIRADQSGNGRVIITGANRALRDGSVAWDLVNSDYGLYAVSHDTLHHRPSRVLYSGTDLQPYPTLEELRRFAFDDPAGYPGPSHGFYWDDAQKRLFVRLHAAGTYGPPDPNRHRMAVAPRNGEGGKGAAGLTIARPEHFNFGIFSPTDHPVDSHVVLDGFTFETPGVAGVFIGSAGAVTIRNCSCIGCRTLVSGRRFFDDTPDFASTTNNVTIRGCDYTQFPAFHDAAEVIARGQPRITGPDVSTTLRHVFWWHRKGTSSDDFLDYSNTYETGIASAVGRGWVFRENHIHDAFEGFSTWSLSTSRKTVIARNSFERLVDNAIESENHAANLVIRRNAFIDVFEPFSWQPLSGTPWPGPVIIRGNRVRVTSRFHEMWQRVSLSTTSGWLPSIFKIGVPQSNWNTDAHPWMAHEPRSSVVVPGRGFIVRGNTILAPGHRLVGRTGPATRYVGFSFRENVVVAGDFDGHDPALREAGIVFEKNTVFLASPRDNDGARLAAGSGGHVLSNVTESGLQSLEAELSPTPGPAGSGERRSGE